MKEKVDTWMPVHIGALLADTLHLSAALFGAYLLLLFHYWRKGPPPDDNATLGTITRLNGSFTEHRETLAAFFSIRDGKWWHKRVEQELKKAKEYKEEKSKAGKAGAAARWGSDDEDHDGEDGSGMAPALAEGMANASQNDALIPRPIPLPSSTPEPSPHTGDRADETGASFALGESKLLKVKSPITLRGYFERCREAKAKPIPDQHAVFAYAEEAKLPIEFVHLCWQEFRAAHIDTDKRQKDWPKTFANYVRRNWYKLWAVDREGAYFLTAAGKQAQKANAK